MRVFGDYHIHTKNSDGHQTIKECSLFAYEKGLKQITISEHSFDLIHGLTKEKFKTQEETIQKINQNYGDFKVLSGVEANITPYGIDVEDEIIKRLDVLLVGFHRFIKPKKFMKDFKFYLVNGWGSVSSQKRQNMIELNTNVFIEILKKYPVDIAVHLLEHMQVDMEKIIPALEETGTYLELNEKHIQKLIPYGEFIKNSNVKMIVCSDAHKKEKIGAFENIFAFIKRFNIEEERVFGINDNKPTFKNKGNYGKNI